MSEVYGARCPWTVDWRCHTNCMLFVTAADADTVGGSVFKGEGHCSIAIAASHIASEKHYGGNYLVKTVEYNDEDAPEQGCNLIEDGDLLHCSNCGGGAAKNLWAYWHFCPNCGARVIGVDE